MIKVTFNQYRNKLKYYHTLISAGEVIEINGLKLCAYVENDQCVRDIKPLSTYVKPTAKDLQALVSHMEAKSDHVREPIVSTYVCDRCKQSADSLMARFEEGEVFNICRVCCKKIGVGFKAIK